MRNPSVAGRRPLRSRDLRWIRSLAARLARSGVRPNAVSVAGLAAACGGAACLVEVPGRAAAAQAGLLLLAAGLVSLRMLSNVLDGLVAVEGGLRTPTGDLFNEVPDRVADVVLLVAAGYAIPLGWPGAFLGWSAGLLAVFTAYVRVFGAALGLPQSFSGPMAKPQRMGTMVVALVLSALESGFAGYQGRVLGAALAVIAVGSLLTTARRLAEVRKGLVGR